MQNFNDPLVLVRTLKGAPLSVFVAMMIVRTRVSAFFLETVTGYTDKPITKALRLLEEYQIVTKNQDGWVLAEGFQLPLTISESELFRLDSSSSSKSNGLSTIKEEQTKNRNNSDFEENIEVLKGYGVRGKKLTLLADLDHVTPEFIRAHMEAVKGDPDSTIGTGIYRIENNWPAPAVYDKGNKYVSGTYSEFVER